MVECLTQIQSPQMPGRFMDKVNFQSLYLFINFLINKPRRNFSSHIHHRDVTSPVEYRKHKSHMATIVTEDTLGRCGVPKSIQ